MAEIIPRYNMLSPGDRVGVAVSGGADSVVLLHLLHRLSAALEIKVLVLHVNHSLRGAESEADEVFVRRLADSLGLEALVAQGPVENGNLEQEARRVRREFFRQAIAGRGLKRVALGHTRSDQAETVLFRLLRGSGLTGLAGMRMVTDDGLIRPLLTTSRAEVREWGAAEGIGWREDSSNLDPRFTRNRLRNEAIPALAREFNPQLEAVLASTAELAQSEEDFWFQLVEPIYREITKRNELGSILQLDGLAWFPIAVQRRVLRRALLDLRGDLRSLDFAHIEAILRLCKSRDGHDRAIVPGVDALRSYDQLLLMRPWQRNAQPRDYRLDLPIGSECRLPLPGGTVSVNWLDRGVENCDNVKEGQEFTAEIGDLDGDLVAAGDEPRALYVRNWQPGDALHRPGHERAEKIKSLFQEHRVLLWERRHWPVVAVGGEIVWVRRFGSAAKYTATGDTRRVLRLVYRRNPE